MTTRAEANALEILERCAPAPVALARQSNYPRSGYGASISYPAARTLAAAGRIHVTEHDGHQTATLASAVRELIPFTRRAAPITTRPRPGG